MSLKNPNNFTEYLQNECGGEYDIDRNRHEDR